MLNETIAACSECTSEFLRASSEMKELCPNCAHYLYGYENCIHELKNGKCIHCFWDGSVSEYIRVQILKNSSGN